MPNIKPISDLRTYNEVLNDCVDGEPVFLTKNGRGRYVILEIEEYEKQQATIKMLAKLAEAEQSVEKEGWKSMDDLKKALEEWDGL